MVGYEEGLYHYRSGQLVRCSEAEFFGGELVGETLEEQMTNLGFDRAKVGSCDYWTHDIWKNGNSHIFVLGIDMFEWFGVRVEGHIEYMHFVRDYLNHLIVHQSQSMHIPKEPMPVTLSGSFTVNMASPSPASPSKIPREFKFGLSRKVETKFKANVKI